ncbi:uncharacterized protein [Nicotiana sylvestris]|uniref:uncharacterized protein n=1 Tax=Nicotiana sylvestris TaxID=4096 RepID=UPI00388C662F
MQNNLDLKVAGLIDEDMHTWKLHRISTTFEPEDVDAILSIPISIIGINDRLLWHHSKSGNYEVKSELLYLSVNIMWQIWKGRNAWCFNQEMLEPTDIVSKALFEYEEYKDLLTSCLAARHSTGNEFVPILTNFQDDVLLFTDAGLRCDDRHASTGVGL